MYIKAFDKKGNLLKKEVFLREKSVYQYLAETHILNMDTCVLYDSNTNNQIKLVYDKNHGGILR